MMGATALLFSTGGGDTNTMVSLSKGMVLSATIHRSLIESNINLRLLELQRTLVLVNWPCDHDP